MEKRIYTCDADVYELIEGKLREVLARRGYTFRPLEFGVEVEDITDEALELCAIRARCEEFARELGEDYSRDYILVDKRELDAGEYSRIFREGNKLPDARIAIITEEYELPGICSCVYLDSDHYVVSPEEAKKAGAIYVPLKLDGCGFLPDDDFKEVLNVWRAKERMTAFKN